MHKVNLGFFSKDIQNCKPALYGKIDISLVPWASGAYHGRWSTRPRWRHKERTLLLTTRWEKKVCCLIQCRVYLSFTNGCASVIGLTAWIFCPTIRKWLFSNRGELLEEKHVSPAFFPCDAVNVCMSVIVLQKITADVISKFSTAKCVRMTPQRTAVRLNPNKQTPWKTKHFVEQHNVLQPHTFYWSKRFHNHNWKKPWEAFSRCLAHPQGVLSERDEGAEGEAARLLKKVDIFTRQAGVEVWNTRRGSHQQCLSLFLGRRQRWWDLQQ